MKVTVTFRKKYDFMTSIRLWRYLFIDKHERVDVMNVFVGHDIMDDFDSQSYAEILLKRSDLPGFYWDYDE